MGKQGEIPSQVRCRIVGLPCFIFLCGHRRIWFELAFVLLPNHPLAWAGGFLMQRSLKNGDTKLLCYGYTVDVWATAKGG